MPDSPPAARRSSGIAAFVLRRKDPIEIVLDGHSDDYIPTYTTLDKIQGKVLIKFDKKTEFDKVAVVFEGITRTFTEKGSSPAPHSGTSVASHVFMRVTQPIDSSRLPAEGIAEAGESYEVPFLFMVPERLLDHVCRHRTDTRRGHHDPTREEHLQVPPSLGDCMATGDGQKVIDDMAPEMSKITYVIRVILAKRRTEENSKDQEVATKFQKLRVVPAREENPPLPVATTSDDYHLRKEKDVKRGTFKLGKIGRIVAEAAQPSALVLPPPNFKSDAPIASATTVNLRFDPINEGVQPPALGILTTKLKVYTYYGTSPYRSVPHKAMINAWDTNRGVYSETVELSARPLSAVQWIRHDPGSPSTAKPAAPRRDSAISVSPITAELSSIPAPTSAHREPLSFYTASILLPIALPHATSPANRKVFLPTFHYCLVSRVYGLELNISYENPCASISTPTIQLKLPVQIASAPNPNARPSISAEEMAAIQARAQIMAELGEVEEYWRPRRMTDAPVGMEVTPEAMHPIPEYTEIEGQAQSTSRRPSVQPQEQSSAQRRSSQNQESSRGPTAGNIHIRGGGISDIDITPTSLHDHLLPGYTALSPNPQLGNTHSPLPYTTTSLTGRPQSLFTPSFSFSSHVDARNDASTADAGDDVTNNGSPALSQARINYGSGNDSMVSSSEVGRILQLGRYDLQMQAFGLLVRDVE